MRGTSWLWVERATRSLHEYCSNDVAITARVFSPLVDQVALRRQTAVWRMDQKMQMVCADMHTVGMYVDQERRLAEEKKLLGVRHSLLEGDPRPAGDSWFQPRLCVPDAGCPLCSVGAGGPHRRDRPEGEGCDDWFRRPLDRGPHPSHSPDVEDSSQ